jgi:trigger factor
MKVEVVATGSYQRKLEVAVPASRVQEAIDRAYRDLSGRARLPGFRKGKVPRKVLEARFGPKVESDVANSLIQEGYSQGVSDHKLEPVGRPQLQDPGTFQAGSDFCFSITVEVKPQVELQNYTGLEVVYPSVEVSDEEVERSVKSRLEGQAKLTEVTDRAVQKGDLALVELFVRDGETELVHEPGTMIRTEADPYYPGVDALIVGTAKDGEAAGTVAFPDSARSEAVRGRELQVTARVLSIQSIEVPELSDDLAGQLGYEGGIEGMRAALRQQIRDARENLARNQARANLLQALINANPFEVPSGMVDQHLEMLMEELRLQQAYRGRDPRSVRFSPEQVADLRVRAEFAAKGGIILEYVSRTEKLEVVDADLEAKYSELADQRGQTVEAIRGYFVKDGAVEELRSRLLEEKTLDWLLERAKISSSGAEAASAG